MAQNREIGELGNKVTTDTSANSVSISSNLFITSTVNAATVQVGTSFVANSSRLVIGTAVGLQANGGVGTSGQVLTSNATTVYWANAVTGVTWTGAQTANFSAVSGRGYPVSTTAGAVTVTMPASPVAGDVILILDYGAVSASNNITINLNGQKLNSIAANPVINTNRAAFNMVYVDSTVGWLIYANYLQSATNQSYTINYLVVAGGGGGGWYIAGGGGAGGMLTGTTTATVGSSYTVTVGGGGAAAAPLASGSTGSSSVFGPYTATYGGGGGHGEGNVPTSGGSGGGGARRGQGGASGTPGQGNAGGTGSASGGGDGQGSGAGGGGAGAVGVSGSGPVAGNGGAGTASPITGTPVTYAGGGAGGAYSATGGTGGSAPVGGNGGPGSVSATSAAANLGGGGGGGGYPTAGAGSGGGGVVIVSYASASQIGSGGTVTTYTSGPTKYYVHTFTTGGTYVA